jgi:hypothetical protein
MMNEWRTTHRTKAGVEVVVRREVALWRVDIVPDGISTGALFNNVELEALFEPIPRPPAVTIPLDVASRYWNQQDSDADHVTMLAAIQAAEVKK